MLATIIVPETIGSPNANCHAEVRDALEATFGGWTAHEATGGWKPVTGEAIEETVTVYDVAMDDTILNRQTMRSLATDVARDLDQEAVYLSFNTAVEVEFITKQPLTKAS